MDNNEQTNPQNDENVLKSIQDKFIELKKFAAESLEQVQEKTEDLIDQVKSSDLAEDTKKTIADLSVEAKEKMSNLAEEAKGIWTKLSGQENKEV